MEMIDRSRVKRYFKRFPKWTIWFILGGLSLTTIFIVASVPLTVGYGIGLLPLILGSGRIYFWMQKPTDAEIDSLIDNDLSKLEDRALVKTGIDRSELVSETVFVNGPRFWKTGGAELGIKKGKDKIVRYMPVGVTVINFTEHQIVAYQCALDITTGNPLNESTDEYFYNDVVSVSTQSRSLTFDGSMLNKKKITRGALEHLVVDGKLQLNAAEIFILTTSGGTSVEVVLKDPKIIESAGGGEIPTDMADKAVQSVRRMLRDKKAR